MSERDARTHTHASNRAIPRPAERKVTFRSALDSPFRISWPKIPTRIQNELFTELVTALEGYADYRANVKRLSRKRKRAERDQSGTEEQQPMEIDDQNNDVYARAKSLDEHMTIGLNEVTKRLETQSREHRNSITFGNEPTEASNTKRDLCLVLVCRADVDPPLLVDHIPHLIASCNSLQKNSIRLATLPQGSEPIIGKALGMRRVTVAGLDIEFPALERFKPLFDSIPLLFAPWLSTIRLSRDLVPTHVKQVKTSAPKDMKAAKEERKKGRTLAKQGKRKRIKIKSSDV